MLALSTNGYNYCIIYVYGAACIYPVKMLKLFSYDSM